MFVPIRKHCNADRRELGMRWLAPTILITTLTVAGCASASGNSGSNPAAGSSVSSQAPGGGASSGPAGGQPSFSPSSSPIVAQCPVQLDEGQANRKGSKPVPGDLQVDWVLRCSVAPRAGGTRYLQVERSDSDPAVLLAALRAPDEARSSGACPAIAMVVPYFALVEPDGSTLVPRLPVNGCRQPQAAAVQALNALRFTVISRTQLP
jgi:hypothetical protein